jgi:hypothetical protein
MIRDLRAYFARKAPRVFRRRKYSGLQVVERVSDIPDHTKALIYIVLRSGVHQWAVFECPCCTGHKITVNLRKHDHPHWTATKSGPAISLHPSLWFHEGCKSHFWIKDNRVRWV